MLKRLLDLICVIPALLLLSPLLLLLAIWVKRDSPGPALFRQTRVGLNGKPFDILKFRSMRLANEGLQITVGDDQRITSSGHFLRRYKLDELPQLLNILKGEMSIIGPRPEVPRYVSFYPPALRDEVLSVRPGLSDFASIHFSQESDLLAQSLQPERDYIDKILPAKLAWHQYYVQHQSLWLDIQLILRTLWQILTGAAPLSLDSLPYPPQHKSN